MHRITCTWKQTGQKVWSWGSVTVIHHIPHDEPMRPQSLAPNPGTRGWLWLKTAGPQNKTKRYEYEKSTHEKEDRREREKQKRVTVRVNRMYCTCMHTCMHTCTHTCTHDIKEHQSTESRKEVKSELHHPHVRHIPTFLGRAGFSLFPSYGPLTHKPTGNHIVSSFLTERLRVAPCSGHHLSLT